MRFQPSFLFLCSVVIIFGLFWIIDSAATILLFGSGNVDQRGPDRTVLEGIIKRDESLLRKIESPAKAKKSGLFWVGDIEGKGFGIDLFQSVSLIESLFPGYGKKIYRDKVFQYNYFDSLFSTASFVESELGVSQLGFRVSYSWTGCFKLYRKFGADVIIFGSSEVYKGLIPKQLSEGLSPLFGKDVKVLICATPAMSTENIKQSAQQLIQVSGQHPKAIIWGYSYWNAYTNSPKMADYKKERDKEIASYLSGGIIKNVLWHFFLNLKISDLFPAISWDEIFNLSVDKIRSNNGNPAKRLTIFQEQTYDKIAEGIYISRAEYEKDDQNLSEYLRTNLKPYYAINNGITEKDCSLTKAKVILDGAIDELKTLSPNIFIYIAPTTSHHRKTVPTCFLPNVTAMLARVSQQKDLHLLTLEPEEYGLVDRDFVYPTLDSDLYYFDINHPNFVGSRKITNRIANWLTHSFNTPEADNQ